MATTWPRRRSPSGSIRTSLEHFRFFLAGTTCASFVQRRTEAMCGMASVKAPIYKVYFIGLMQGSCVFAKQIMKLGAPGSGQCTCFRSGCSAHSPVYVQPFVFACGRCRWTLRETKPSSHKSRALRCDVSDRTLDQKVHSSMFWTADAIQC